MLTNTPVSKLHKAFGNNSSAIIKLSKTQLHKIERSEGIWVSLFGLLLRTGLHSMKDVLKPLAKGVIIPLVLTAVASATDAAIHKKIIGFGNMTLIMSNKEMNDIIKIDNHLKNLVFW